MRTERRMLLVLSVVLLGAAVLATGESKYVLSSKRLSSTAVALSCANGADPTGKKFGQVLIISCKEQEGPWLPATK